MQELNLALFALINGAADAAGWALWLPILIAKFSWLVDVVMLGWVWEEGVDADRVDILLAVAAVLLGVAINYLFHQFLYLPRPGEMGIGNILLKHQFTARFPSNHGTGTLAVAIIFLFNKRWRGVGLLLTAVGLLTCWARVYLGVHLPFDMLGAALVALLCTILVRPAAERFARLVGARLSPAYALLRGR